MLSNNPNDFRDTTAHLFDAKVYVYCHLCSVLLPALATRNWRHLCKDCRYRPGVSHEKLKMDSHLSYSRRHKLQATLTLKEWLDCLDFFNWCCAYCGEKYQIFEHVIPVLQGGGTTIKNCLPSCRRCDRAKIGHPAPPDMRSEYVEKIQEYLRAIEFA